MVVVEMPFSTVEDMNLSQGKGDANNSQEMTLIRGAESMTVLFLLLCVLYQSEILTTGEKKPSRAVASQPDCEISLVCLCLGNSKYG